MPPIDAARLVTIEAWTPRRLAESEEPPLKPNQPNCQSQRAMAVQAYPEEDRTEDDMVHVGRAVGELGRAVAATLAEPDRERERAGARGHVDGSSAGKVERAELEEPAVGLQSQRRDRSRRRTAQVQQAIWRVSSVARVEAYRIVDDGSPHEGADHLQCQPETHRFARTMGPIRPRSAAAPKARTGVWTISEHTGSGGGQSRRTCSADGSESTTFAVANLVDGVRERWDARRAGGRELEDVAEPEVK